MLDWHLSYTVETQLENPLFLCLELAMPHSPGAYLTTQPLPLSWHWHTPTQVILTQAIPSDLYK